MHWLLESLVQWPKSQTINSLQIFIIGRLITKVVFTEDHQIKLIFVMDAMT